MLAGKKILVTGASSGIGHATARALLQHGAAVIATGRKEAPLRALGCPYVVANLTMEGECRRVVETAAAVSDAPLTGLVNSAGILQGGAFGSDKTTLANFDLNFNTNTRAVFEMMTHAIPHLKKAGRTANSCIVNVSSVNGKHPFAACAAYCASKAAVDMLTRCAAVDLAEYGIRAVAVNPGVVVTELQKRGGLDESAYAAFLKRSIEVTHPLAAARGKVGEAWEVAELIAFLQSDNAAFITGECIAIDGGRQCLGAR